jgi:hypothetical protein
MGCGLQEDDLRMRRGEELSISNAGGKEARYYASMVYVEMGESDE